VNGGERAAFSSGRRSAQSPGLASQEFSYEEVEAELVGRPDGPAPSTPEALRAQWHQAALDEFSPGHFDEEQSVPDSELLAGARPDTVGDLLDELLARSPPASYPLVPAVSYGPLEPPSRPAPPVSPPQPPSPPLPAPSAPRCSPSAASGSHLEIRADGFVSGAEPGVLAQAENRNGLGGSLYGYDALNRAEAQMEALMGEAAQAEEEGDEARAVEARMSLKKAEVLASDIQQRRRELKGKSKEVGPSLQGEGSKKQRLRRYLNANERAEAHSLMSEIEERVEALAAAWGVDSKSIYSTICVAPHKGSKRNAFNRFQRVCAELYPDDFPPERECRASIVCIFGAFGSCFC